MFVQRLTVITSHSATLSAALSVINMNHYSAACIIRAPFYDVTLTIEKVDAINKNSR